MRSPGPAPSWRQWAGRVLQLGPPRLAMGLAALFVLLALASPFWAFAADSGGGDRVNRVYGWTTFTEERFESGVWDRTVIQSYGSPNFREPNIAGVLGASYIALLVFFAALVAAILLFSWERTRTLAPLPLLALSLVVIVIGLIALLYPVLALPWALTDLAPDPVSGSFWGSAASGGVTFTWGAGLAWWFTLVAFVAGTLGVALPYVTSIRAMGPPRPRDWSRPR